MQANVTERAAVGAAVPRSLFDVSESLRALIVAEHADRNRQAHDERPLPKRFARPVLLSEMETGRLLMALRGAATVAELLAADAERREFNAECAPSEVAEVLTHRQAGGLAQAVAALIELTETALEAQVCEHHDAELEAELRGQPR